MKRTLFLLLIFSLSAAAPYAFSLEGGENETPTLSEDGGGDVSLEKEDLFLEDFDELDDLFADVFADAEDTVATQEQETAAMQSSPEKKERQVLTFYGSFAAKALYSRQIVGKNEDKNYPAASLSYTLGGTLRPSDSITGHFAVTTSFPGFDLALSSLYFDYDLFGKAYMTVGYTAVSWGNSAIFTTNILDTSAHMLALLTVPFGRGQFEAAVHSSVGASKPADLLHYLYYMASVEYPFSGILYKAFMRTWPTLDTKSHKGAVGAEITGDLFGLHFTLHEDVQSAKGGFKDFERSNFVAGLSKWWTSPEKIGAVAEYQFIYDKSKDEAQSHEVALQATWRHILGSRYTTSLYSKYSITKKNFVVIPALSISGLPHASVNFALPVLIGEGASWTLSDGTGYTVSETDADYSLESLGNFAVFLSCGISISFSH